MNFIDMHCDTISAIYKKRKENVPIHLRENSLHLDLNKMKQAGYIAQNFAIFIDLNNTTNPFEEAIAMIDCFYEEIHKNDDLISFASSYNDIISNLNCMKMSALLTLEEGGMIKGDPSLLRTFYRLGARMMTLTWNYENELASPSTNYSNDKKPDVTVPFTKWGLTNLGFDIITEMESLGMIIDVSHLSDPGFFDVLNNTKNPFVASHSNARAICNHARNLSDEMIYALANRGGVIGINFHPPFLKDPLQKTGYLGAIDDMILHIKHIEQIGGIESIALGSDFDGIPGNKEMTNVCDMPKLYDTLHFAGFSDNQIDKICYQNVLRVYKDIL